MKTNINIKRISFLLRCIKKDLKELQSLPNPTKECWDEKKISYHSTRIYNALDIITSCTGIVPVYQSLFDKECDRLYITCDMYTNI